MLNSYTNNALGAEQTLSLRPKLCSARASLRSSTRLRARAKWAPGPA